MKIPGFTAEASLYKMGTHYQADRHAINSPIPMIIPAIPNCQNCDYILEQCEIHGWRPRAVCNACLFGNCYNEPPMPDPFPDPFGRPPRF
ncbi:MAG TPA: hypothetical protein VJJ51_12060 [Candidatus Methanoperedens sp.]|nr:hypothetical protein [Candidatus Methanoperedens sp.]HLB71768.1 hypothetical protein [Candidatus Methanoperedens sp.]